MSDILREFKVSELNRILPMVRETIKKERRLKELEDNQGTRNKNADELEKIKQVISTLEGIPQVLEFSSTLKNALNEIAIDSEIAAQNKRKNELIESINNYDAEINELTKQWVFEANLYRSITSAISTDGGFMRPEEIKIVYFPEYLYLLAIDTSFTPKFTLERFIKEDSMDSFFELIRTNLSNPYANDVADSLRYGMLDKTMFFSFFK